MRQLRLAAIAAILACASTPAVRAADTIPQVVSGTPSGAQGDTWNSIKQLPDWSGVWQPAMTGFGPAQYRIQMPLTPEWQKKFDVVRKLSEDGGDVPSRTYHCIPMGFPGGMTGPETLLEFLFTPGRVTITDVSDFVRRIYTDGRKLPADPDLSFEGISVGHWENGALIVETVGLDPGNEFLYGLPGGKDMHVLERMSLKDKNTLEILTSIDAPQALTKTYTRSQLYKRSTLPMQEYDCAQNNRDVDPLSGKQQFNLAPPPHGG